MQNTLLRPGAPGGRSSMIFGENLCIPVIFTEITKKSLNFTHSKWLPELADDMSYEFLAYAQPVEGWGNIGLNIALLKSQNLLVGTWVNKNLEKILFCFDFSILSIDLISKPRMFVFSKKPRKN